MNRRINAPHNAWAARKAWLAASLGLLVVVAAGCDIPLFRASETLTDVFPTSKKPKVTVETFNGSIDVSNGNDNEVVVELTKRASGFDQNAADQNLENLEVTMHAASEDEVIIRVKRVGSTIGDCGASVIVAVPPDATVDLKSSNGYIVSEGLRGNLKADTSNAKVDVVEATGDIEVETSNGPILIEATDARVKADTSNSAIRFRGTFAKGDHELSTSNGPIDVRLPADSQFDFVAETSNGGVDVEFDYEGGKSRRRNKRSGTVGADPQFTLELETGNSSINIRKDD
jgi:DUF4097 and DUF4098 domain-containing protein YvlB